MAFTFTVSGTNYVGAHKSVYGTFTTATGDTSASLSPTTHGLNNVEKYLITFDSSALNTTFPKVANSAGTLTISCEDTLGVSGRWEVEGK